MLKDLIKFCYSNVDKLLHAYISSIILSYSFSILVTFGINRAYSLFISLLVTLLIGVLKEINDMYVNKSNFDYYNIIADIVGILIAFIPLVI